MDGRLVAELASRGVPVIRLRPFEPHDGLSVPGGHAVVYRGSVYGVREAAAHRRWRPGVFYEPSKFECRSYYPWLGRRLLNDRHVFLTLGELKRREAWAYDTFGVQDAVFVRPDGNDKSFTGFVLFRERFAGDLELNCPDDAVVIVSEPAGIDAEYRVFVGLGRVITGSRYKLGPKVDVAPELPDGAATLAAEVAALPGQPAEIYALDVCRTGDEWRVVEINSFNSSGLYAADLGKLIDAVHEIVERDGVAR